jgi:LysR family transcriptional activator of mexEF-oprN operon
MNNSDIRRLDLNLLLILLSLLRTCKTTATAHELGLTQSTISHALAKLRDILKDPLFIRQQNGLLPTPRARALQPQLARIIELTREAVRRTSTDPTREPRLIRIAGTDYPCSLLAAPLLERLESRAPQIRVSFRSLVRRDAIDALSSGELDFAIGPFPNTHESVERQLLWTDDYVIVVRKRHPTIKSSCSLSQYVAARHVLVSQDGDLVGLADHALSDKKLARAIIAAVPYFLSALATVGQSNAISTMPRAVARAYATQFGLRLLPCPIHLRPLKVHLLVSRHFAADPLRPWLQDLISRTAHERIK